MGARIEIIAGDRIQRDEVRSGGYHISHSDFRIHFGLGDHDEVNISVRWPNGEETAYGRVSSNTWVVLKEGEAKIQVRQKLARTKN